MGGHVAADLYLGLMSGTSLDGFSVALVDWRDSRKPELLATRLVPIAADLRRALMALSTADPLVRLDDLAQLDADLGLAFAEACRDTLSAANVRPVMLRAIGLSGHTIRHRPMGRPAYTWQLGDPFRTAEMLDCQVVADFRRRDVAAGGQGAPLVPAFHASQFATPGSACAVLNLGGIGNLSLLDAEGTVRGLDTGPANALLDAWCMAHGQGRFDRDGAWAASGVVHEPLLHDLLEDSFFALPAPRSTGREVFHLAWLRAAAQRFGCPLESLAPADVQATLSALTAQSVAAALRRFERGPGPLWVCGGGVHNRDLMSRLADALADRTVESSAARGVDPDWVEAMAFSWLARQTLHLQAGNIPKVTGAAGFRVLGALIPARPVSAEAG